MNDAVLLTVEFANGAQGVIQVSAVAHVAERFMHQSLAFYGADGSSETDFQFDGPNAGAVLRGARQGDDHFRPLPIPAEFRGDIDPTQPIDRLFQELFSKHTVGVRLFIDAILADRPVSPNFYDGLQAQAVIDAALAHTVAVVGLPLPRNGIHAEQPAVFSRIVSDFWEAL